MPKNDGYTYRDLVRPADAGEQVLAYHAARFQHSSHAAWRRAIEDGQVLVNGVVADCERVLRAGDRLEFHRPPWEEPEAPLHFGVAYEDEDVLVVDKPSGLQVLPAGAYHANTLLYVVRRSSPARAQSSPVHRLGRGTSGLVLFGKHTRALAFLSAQFRDFSATKTYLALAQGTALPVSCIARHPIGTLPHGPLDVSCVQPGGRPSTTRLRVLARDHAHDRSLVAAQPITGRPDQIRIHLAACGAPLVGDPLFGAGGLPIHAVRPGDGGYFLHATALSVRHPADGRLLKLRSRPDWLTDSSPGS
ncbi:MAG: RluA family pseudouridine synthase [Planctomycetes bacterium]|nr:RluA family pseudouridine synthase [Planctomycetota bacterium]